MGHMDWSLLNVADYFILGSILLSAVLSVSRGFVREALSLAGWFGAFWLSMHYAPQVYPMVSKFLAMAVHSNEMRAALTQGLLFVVILFGLTFVIGIIAGWIRNSSLSGVDRLVGLLFGLARGVFIVALSVGLVSKVSAVTEHPQWKGSQCIPEVKPISDWLLRLFPHDLSWDDLYKN